MESPLLTRPWGFLLGLLLIVTPSLSAQGRDPARARDRAKQIVTASGVGGGLIVHLGCKNGELTAELSQGGKFLVQGLSSDAVAVEKARGVIRRRSLYGRVSVDRHSMKRLPYAANLVNVAVSEDLPELLAGGLSPKEILRIIVPLGSLVARGAGLSAEKLKGLLAEAGIANALVTRHGDWWVVHKPWPDGMGEWTHDRGNANGNPVSEDTAAPPAQLQWVSERQTHGAPPLLDYLSVAAVSAKGRLFTVVGTGTVNPPRKGLALGDLFLVARDAFNGKPLTTNPQLETLFLHMQTTGIGVTLKKRRAPDDQPLEAK